jgi:integrase
MERVNLTPDRIRKLASEDGKSQSFLWDETVRNLAVRVTASGVKSFVFEAKLDRQNIRITLGDALTMPLTSKGGGKGMQAGAREVATRYKAMVDEGHDPRQVIKANIREHRKARSLEQLKTMPALEAWKHYLEDNTDRWGARHLADHIEMAKKGGERFTRGSRINKTGITREGILRKVLELPLAEINREVVEELIKENKAKRPTRTRLAVSLLNTFLVWCGDRKEYRGFVVADACDRLKKKLPSPAAKKDNIEREQLKPWFESVQKIPNPVISYYLQALLITGARREELAALKWEDCDLRWDKLTIKDKIEGTRDIPLTPYVKEMILSLRNRSYNVITLSGKSANPPKSSKYVFSSTRSASGYLVEPRIAHHDALKEAGLTK